MLKYTKLLKTQSQYETVFTGVFSPLIQHTLMTSLRSDSLFLYTMSFTKIPTVLFREKPVSELSDIGKETLCRAQLGSERRFCVNDSEVVSGAPVVKSCHDMIMLQLDIHTIRTQHM